MAQVVGIFSRSGDMEYEWLTQRLKPGCEVLTVYISNDNHHVLIQEISRCQYAILYHTKNRGRINITDVTDSLYDEEIVLMSDRLGKDYVLAVIDDLEESSEEFKERIKNSQPTLRDRTRNIFLFTRQDKQDEEILREKVQLIIDLIQGDEDMPTKIVNICDRRLMGQAVQIVTVTGFSWIVGKEAYGLPDRRNLVLASLWGVGLYNVLSRKPSEYFWFNPRIHSMVSWTVTLVSFYNAYCRPNTANIGLSALWLISSLCRARSHRRPLGWRGWAFKSMGYGLVWYSFWKGWQMRNTTEVSKLIIQTVLCSPAILTALWFPRQWTVHRRPHDLL